MCPVASLSTLRSQHPQSAPIKEHFVISTIFSNAELDQLWRELAECKEENGFVALPKGLQRLFPLVKEKLMVRECYIKLLKIVEERSGVQLLPGVLSADYLVEDGAVPKAGMALEKGYIGRLFHLDCSVYLTF